MLSCRIQKKLSDFSLDLDFQVGAETLVIAGPSGNGKSMTLRSLAGLVPPDTGQISVGERILFDHRRKINLPAERRNIGFVFQNYALFPHFTVEENIAYGLRSRKLSQSARNERVTNMLEKLNIVPLRDRLPSELSGGEQQRTALARALVLEPSALLLDEPLSALDITTRGKVRRELKRILSTLEIPTILVTHDYEDAISLGDRILVLESGAVVQQGTASDLLNKPHSQFVADFSGSHYFSANVIGHNSEMSQVKVGEGKQILVSVESVPGGNAAVVVFPWDIELALQGPKLPAKNGWWSIVTNVLNYGNKKRVVVEGRIPLTAEVGTDWNISEGDRVFVIIPADKVHLISRD